MNNTAVNVQERQTQIIRMGLLGIAVNILLAVSKMIFGLLSRSIAIVLDAVNNMSDILSALVTVVGVKIAGKPADREHPYGHGRYEYLSAMIVSAIILYAGVSAIIEAIRKILSPEDVQYSPGVFITVSIAVAAKLILGRLLILRGKLLRSDALRNSGKDALLDAVLSAATMLAAVLYVAFGLKTEAWIGLLISLAILKAGIDMFRETVSKILGERIESALSSAVKETILETPGVIGVYDLILNSYGPERLMGSVHIEIPDTWNAERIDTVSHEITQRVLEKNGVILTAVGILSLNTTDDKAKEMRSKVTETVLAEPYVLEIHGFRCDLTNKTIHFDLVVDFLAPQRRLVYSTVLEKVQEIYPDYTIQIEADSDYSD